MINIAVVEDEKIIREQIRGLIKGRTPDSLVDTYSSGEALLAAGKYYDVIFLDIQMDGMNGMETARNLRQQNAEKVIHPQNSVPCNRVNIECCGECVIIFVTGIKEYVFEAFEVSAFHYLLKPIEEKKFTQVLEGAIAEVEKRRQQGHPRLFLKTKTQNITLQQSNILYMESRGKKVEIHTIDRIIEIYAAIKELEQQMDESFYRCHRGYLVNMAYIAEYTNESITLSNGEKLLLSKEKYGEFVKVYMRYLRNGGVVCV